MQKHAIEINVASAIETKNIATKKNIYFVQTLSTGVHFIMFHVIIPFHFTEGKLRLGAHQCPGYTAPEHRADQGAPRTYSYHTVLCRAELELPVAVHVTKSREKTEDGRAGEGSIKTSKTRSDWDPQGIGQKGLGRAVPWDKRGQLSTHNSGTSGRSLEGCGVMETRARAAGRTTCDHSTK